MWLEDDSVIDDGEDDSASTNQAPSSTAQYSGWNVVALRAEASHPTATKSTESKGKSWAKIKVCFVPCTSICAI